MSDIPLFQEGLKNVGSKLWPSIGPQRVEDAGVAEDGPRSVDELGCQGVLTQVLDKLPPGVGRQSSGTGDLRSH